ncbi:MAG: type II toxin-antitoxin system VapC family toxin [Thaumarchaeota archaeon]|nr:type II toxin-antitoxin system VapC family toxin [Nitrososphaerota archaeon]
MILLDTSFLVAYFNQKDVNHSKAMHVIRNIVEKKFGTLYITDYVFNETVTVSLIKMKSLDKAAMIGNYILKAMQTIRVEEDVFLDAWKIFQRQKGTRLGFTDCTTVAIMRYRGIDNIATFDKDFTKIDGVNCISP